LWRNLKYLKWHGFGHTNAVPGPGALALFCAACPQPSVNLPNNWKEDPEQYETLKIQYRTRLTIVNRWKFTRGFVFDGNFSAEQLKMKYPENDVHLSDGNAFLVGAARYTQHLGVAKEIKQVGQIRFAFRSS